MFIITKDKGLYTVKPLKYIGMLRRKRKSQIECEVKGNESPNLKRVKRFNILKTNQVL